MERPTGRVVVTGANSGVGFEATDRLLAGGAEVVMVCRDAARGQKAADSLRRRHPQARLALETADLSSLKAVRDLGARLRGTGVTALVNNAGVARPRLELTEDGLERTMATNHLGPFLLTLLLLGDLVGARGRVVNVASKGHYEGDLRRASLPQIFRGEVAYGVRQTYCDSKLANVLFALELHRRYGARGLTAVAVHPGVLATGIWNKLGGVFGLLVAPLIKLRMDTPAVGGEAVSRLLLDADLRRRSGVYFDVFSEKEPSRQAQDADLAARLWDASERAVDCQAQPPGA